MSETEVTPKTLRASSEGQPIESTKSLVRKPGFAQRIGERLDRFGARIQKFGTRIMDRSSKYLEDLFTSPDFQKIATLNVIAILAITVATGAAGAIPLAVFGFGALALTNTALMSRVMENKTVQTTVARAEAWALGPEGRKKFGHEPGKMTDWAAVRANASHSRPQTSQVSGQETTPQKRPEGPIVSGVKPQQRPALGA